MANSDDKNLRDAIGVISFLLLAGFFTLLLVNTELGFGWYILLCIIALGFSAFLPSMLDSSNKNKQIENQKRELERIKLVEEALQPQVDIVERMMNDANPLSDIEQTLLQHTLEDRKRIILAAFIKVLEYNEDNVEISADYETYLDSIHTKYLSNDLKMSNPLYEEYIKNCTLSKVLRGEFPQHTIKSCPLNLEAGEVILWMFNSVVLYQEVTKTQYVGGSRGFSIRIAKGLYYRTGSFKGEPITTTSLKPILGGDLIITNKNTYFYSIQKSIKHPHNKVIAYVPFEDAIGIQPSRANSKTQYIIGIDGRFAINLLSNLKNLT